MINIMSKIFFLCFFVFYCAPKNSVSSVQSLSSNGSKEVQENNDPNASYKVQLDDLQKQQSSSCNVADADEDKCNDLKKQIQNVKQNIDFNNLVKNPQRGYNLSFSNKHILPDGKVEHICNNREATIIPNLEDGTSKRIITCYYDDGVVRSQEVLNDGSYRRTSNPPKVTREIQEDIRRINSGSNSIPTDVLEIEKVLREGTKQGYTLSKNTYIDATQDYTKVFDDGSSEKLERVNGKWVVKSSRDVFGKEKRYTVTADGTSTLITPPPIQYDNTTNTFTNLNENVQNTIDDLINDPNRNDNVTLSPDDPMLKGAQSGAAAAEAFLKKNK
jgi:hypothetical protein